MSKVTLELACPTPPEWAEYIVAHFDPFLVDHANCERKASALAMSFVVRYADRSQMIAPLIELAQEELEHFAQVYQLMTLRGLRIEPDIRDPYVNGLLQACRTGRETRLLDRLLVSSIVETRGAERFRLVSEALPDPDLKAFYRTLWACEAKHGNLFVELALKYFPEDALYARLRELLAAEGELVGRLEWRPSLH